jgi:adenosine deaminase
VNADDEEEDAPRLPGELVERIPRARLPELLRAMPKVELHLHVEGSLEPEHAFALAQRNGVRLPYASAEALRAAYAFDSLQSFLDVYYAGASVLLEEQDFEELCWNYLVRAARDRVVRAEIFFDPQTHTARGVPIQKVVRGLARACDRGRTELGLSADLILCFLRHLPESEAFAILEAALPLRQHFIGVGLDSSEVGHPPEDFARVFARARELGFHRVAHAGEEGPASNVRGALDALGAERIDHGVRCLEDPRLVARLCEERVPLTVCPFSNVALRVVPDLAHHPLPELLRAGLVATVNSDDPAYFGGYVAQNFVDTFAALPQLGPEEAYALARNAVESAFVAPAERAQLFARVDACFQRFASGR